ncbi:MAG: glycosyltransferase family 4 protein [Chloroflexota bacterium]
MPSLPLAVAHVNDIASVASTLAIEQQRRGMRTLVLDPAKPGARLPFPWKLAAAPLRFAAMTAVLAQVAASRIDLLHIHYATQALIGAFAARPWIVHCHGTDIRGLDPRSAWGRYVGTVLQRAGAVVYSTPDLARDAERFRSDAIFLPNPIDVEQFAPSSHANRDVLLGVKLDSIKGAEVAIESIALLLDRRPETTVTVINSGSLVGEAQRRLGRRVRYIEPSSHEDMPQLLRQHRTTLGQFRLGILSQYELESMATGLVVVADIHCPNPDASVAPVLPARSAGEAADRLQEVLDDESSLLRLSQAGRSWVVDHHAVASVVDRLEALYRTVRAR